MKEQSTTYNETMSDLFNGYELLLFKKFQSEPQIWLEWKEKLFQNEETDLNFGVGYQTKMGVQFKFVHGIINIQAIAPLANVGIGNQ